MQYGSYLKMSNYAVWNSEMLLSIAPWMLLKVAGISKQVTEKGISLIKLSVKTQRTKKVSVRN